MLRLTVVKTVQLVTLGAKCRYTDSRVVGGGFGLIKQDIRSLQRWQKR